MYILLLSNNDEFIDRTIDTLNRLKLASADIACSSVDEVSDCEVQPPSFVFIDAVNYEIAPEIFQNVLAFIRQLSPNAFIFVVSDALAEDSFDAMDNCIAVLSNNFTVNEIREYFQQDEHDMQESTSSPSPGDARTPSVDTNNDQSSLVHTTEFSKLEYNGIHDPSDSNSSPNTADSQSSCKIVGFVGPKGGSGLTLITVSVGIALAKRHPNQVILLDLVAQCGDVAMYLNTQPRYTVADLLLHRHALDDSFIEGSILKHKSGLHFIAGPSNTRNLIRINDFPDHMIDLGHIIQSLSKHYKFILIDGGNYDHKLLEGLARSFGQFFIVGNLDVPSLRGMVHVNNNLQMNGVSEEKINIVFNRYNSKHQLDVKEFEKTIGHPIVCHIPNNFFLCIEAINSGQTLIELDPSSDVVKAVDDLSLHIDDSFETSKPVTKKSFKSSLTKMFTGKG